MKIIFVRHGETDTNIRAVAGEEIVDDDAPLNAKGKSQAENVANELKDEVVDVIFTSPKQRAIETADEIARFHNVPVIKMDDLRERDCGPITRELWHAMFNFDNKIDGEGIESITGFFREFTIQSKRLRLLAIKTWLWYLMVGFRTLSGHTQITRIGKGICARAIWEIVSTWY